MSDKALKETIYNFCEDFINGRIFRIKSNIETMQEALTSETKSSAGDKHETGRAMIQLEREKLGQQLLEAEKMKRVFSQIQIEGNPNIISLGSLVYTSKGTYFLGISAGQHKDIFCISVGTPIGRLLLGKSQGDSIVFNNEEIHITKIL